MPDHLSVDVDVVQDRGSEEVSARVRPLVEDDDDPLDRARDRDERKVHRTGGGGGGGEAEAHHHASHAPAKPRPCVPTPGDTGGYGIGQRRPTANEEKASRSDDVEARRASAAMRSTHAQW